MSKFQRRHYEEIAKVIAKMVDYCEGSTGAAKQFNSAKTIGALIGQMETMLHRDNPSFNTDAFDKACRFSIINDIVEEGRERGFKL